MAEHEELEKPRDWAIIISFWSILKIEFMSIETKFYRILLLMFNGSGWYVSMQA